MRPPYELIVFDWDGTIMDSTAKIVRCFQWAAAEAGVPEPSDYATRHIIGLALPEAIVRLFPDCDASVRTRIADGYRKHFFSPDDEADVLFPGVGEGLRRLSQTGYLLAVATGKSRRGLNHVLRNKAIAGYFCVTRCADEARSKPHPQMLHDILDYTGVNAERAIMVGDTTYDLEMAKTTGMASLAVSYGAHAVDQLEVYRPMSICHSFGEVLEWFLPDDWICRSDALVDGGDGVRFTVQHDGRRAPAFAVRYRGEVHAYLNVCTHKNIELDWIPGRFFDSEGRHLICATHGAMYEPSSGKCAGGPCNGGLAKLEVIEKNSDVYLAKQTKEVSP
jgi:phosphoglycolate phosphatase